MILIAINFQLGAISDAFDPAIAVVGIGAPPLGWRIDRHLPLGRTPSGRPSSLIGTAVKP